MHDPAGVEAQQPLQIDKNFALNTNTQAALGGGCVLPFHTSRWNRLLHICSTFLRQAPLVVLTHFPSFLLVFALVATTSPDYAAVLSLRLRADRCKLDGSNNLREESSRGHRYLVFLRSASLRSVWQVEEIRKGALHKSFCPVVFVCRVVGRTTPYAWVAHTWRNMRYRLMAGGKSRQEMIDFGE